MGRSIRGGPDKRFSPDWNFDQDDPPGIEFDSAVPQGDEKVRSALRRERIGQQRFRERVLSAYAGQCAVTSCNVDKALEAAHIENYSGLHSQVVSNGILLRRDLHALFDAHLISFDQVNGRYRLCDSYLLGKTDYAALEGAVLRTPGVREFRPNADFLEAHRTEFDRQEKRREKEGAVPYGVA